MKELKYLTKTILRKFGLEVSRYTSNSNEPQYVSLTPEDIHKDNVLLSYVKDPFLLKDGEAVSNVHTNHWESVQIAQIFLDMGYCVDVISYKDNDYIPDKNYSIFVGVRTNFERIAQLLNKDCLKIVHLDTAHWLFSDSSAYSRCLALQKRRGIVLDSFKYKWVNPNWAIECSDCATMLGNAFTHSTYSYAKKKIYSIPIPSVTVYPWSEDKDYEKCKMNYLWFGSSGLVHKGLDLVLEAFTEMPDYRLTVCGPIKEDKKFEDAFYKELYHTHNINTVGWIDVNSTKFDEIFQNCVGLIYPSCSEGQSGAVVTCLQAGLIPIISRESGVDVDEFGMILHDCSVNEIKNSIKLNSGLTVQELKIKSRKAWEYARKNHSRKKFTEQYSLVMESIINNHRKQELASSE